MSPSLRQIAPGVHVAEAPQRFYGLEVGARMTALQLDGGLLLHSPLAMPPDAAAGLGAVRWALAPNLFHHLYVGPWIDAGAEAWAAPGLPEKRPDLKFAGTVAPGAAPFGDEVALMPLTCFPFANEVAVLHRPSRTLIVSDLVFNFPPSAPWRTRATMWCMGGYPGCRTTILERIGFRRDVARRELTELAGWDFDRVIMAHGEIIETGGKATLLDAFRWLSLPAGLLGG